MHGCVHFFFGTLFGEDFRADFEDFDDFIALGDFDDFDNFDDFDFDDFDFIVREAFEEDERDVALLTPDGLQEDASKFFSENSCAECDALKLSRRIFSKMRAMLVMRRLLGRDFSMPTVVSIPS